MNRVAWIDFAKALAILGVIAVHVSQVVPLPQWAHLAASFGAMGVQLFFLLSAYCLCMTWKDGALDWRWWWRKYMRLALWYLAGIVLYGAYHAFADDGRTADYTFWNVAANMFMVNGFIPSAQNTIVPGGWSISCIALFVFAYPALRRLRMRTLLAAGAAGCALSAAGYLWLGWSRFYAYCSPINQFIVFAFGVCLYKLRERIGMRVAVLMAVVFFVMAVAAVVFCREYNIFYRHVLMALSFFGLAVVIMRCNCKWGGGYYGLADIPTKYSYCTSLQYGARKD